MRKISFPFRVHYSCFTLGILAVLLGNSPGFGMDQSVSNAIEDLRAAVLIACNPNLYLKENDEASSNGIDALRLVVRYGNSLLEPTDEELAIVLEKKFPKRGIPGYQNTVLPSKQERRANKIAEAFGKGILIPLCATPPKKSIEDMEQHVPKVEHQKQTPKKRNVFELLAKKRNVGTKENGAEDEDKSTACPPTSSDKPIPSYEENLREELEKAIKGDERLRDVQYTISFKKANSSKKQFTRELILHLAAKVKISSGKATNEIRVIGRGSTDSMAKENALQELIKLIQKTQTTQKKEKTKPKKVSTQRKLPRNGTSPSITIRQPNEQLSVVLDKSETQQEEESSTLSSSKLEMPTADKEEEKAQAGQKEAHISPSSKGPEKSKEKNSSITPSEEDKENALSLIKKLNLHSFNPTDHVSPSGDSQDRFSPGNCSWFPLSFPKVVQLGEQMRQYQNMIQIFRSGVAVPVISEKYQGGPTGWQSWENKHKPLAASKSDSNTSTLQQRYQEAMIENKILKQELEEEKDKNKRLKEQINSSQR